MFTVIPVNMNTTKAIEIEYIKAVLLFLIRWEARFFMIKSRINCLSQKKKT